MTSSQKKLQKGLLEIKKAKKYKYENEIRITNPPKEVRESLYNIADHIGVTFASFMKAELRKIVDSYPEKYKLPLVD